MRARTVCNRVCIDMYSAFSACENYTHKYIRFANGALPTDLSLQTQWVQLESLPKEGLATISLNSRKKGVCLTL